VRHSKLWVMLAEVIVPLSQHRRRASFQRGRGFGWSRQGRSDRDGGDREFDKPRKAVDEQRSEVL
jgi:hypothetical protein